MPRPQRRDREFDKPALQARARRTRDVRRPFKHAEHGREVRLADRPRGRVAKPGLGAPGKGGLARGVERAEGRLGKHHHLFQGRLQAGPSPTPRP